MEMPAYFLDEVMDYVRKHDMILRTTGPSEEGLSIYTAALQYRMDDSLYQTGGSGRTQAEAIYAAYRSWRNYWRKAGEPNVSVKPPPS
jgi:hypothetical protein